MRSKKLSKLRDREDAKRYLLYLLSRRDYSKSQLEKKLTAREFSIEDTQSLLDEFILEGWFRESNYQKSRTRQLLKKGLGSGLVKAKLRQEKCPIGDEAINEAFESLGSSSDLELSELIKKYLRKLSRGQQTLTSQEIQSKLIKSLIPKGHRIDDIKRIYKNLEKDF